MSRTTVLSVWHDREPEVVKEFGNSWGSAPYVWDILNNKSSNPGITYFENLDKLINECVDNKNNPEYLRAVVLMTCDYAYISKASFKRAANDIKKFLEEYPPETGNINHWFGFASLLEDKPDVPAIGFWMTSVSENPFQGEYDEDLDDYKPFDWSKTFEIYDHIEEVNNET